MKRFISTELFLSLKEASQKGTDVDAQVLENGYDEFAKLLFSQCIVFQDKVIHYHSLVYTRAELAGLTRVSGEKCNHIS
jgi:hypothetical protein